VARALCCGTVAVVTDDVMGADDRFVFRGPCAFCGGSDARHRVVDAWVERVAAGEPVALVAAEFGVPAVWVEVACVAAGVPVVPSS
jgi:hypothetical protein